MRRLVLTFISLTLLSLTAVPLINIKLGTAQQHLGKDWWSNSVLYNLDFALPYLNRSLYTIGISTKPGQVVIGKNDWLYLGDRHERTISVRRLGTTQEDAESATKIGLATTSWRQWLKANGVRRYLLMLCPNKDTIYPEYAPDWMQATNNTATNILLANVSQELYVDPRAALWAAKTQFSVPLYYKTDTHWNNLGAWVAFRTLTMELARTEAELSWLSEQDAHVSNITERHGGDLANFLRMTSVLRDSEVGIEIVNGRSVETTRYDFETGHVMASGGNPPVGVPQRPLLIKSPHALNQKRVLWLRDSFGNAMSPYMAATFTETLQADYRKTDPVQFAHLVNTYKPDYVFTTMVERDARVGWFARLPPAQ